MNTCGHPIAIDGVSQVILLNGPRPVQSLLQGPQLQWHSRISQSHASAQSVGLCNDFSAARIHSKEILQNVLHSAPYDIVRQREESGAYWCPQ